MAATDLASQIGTSAQQPKRVKTDALEAEAQPVESQIAADRYLSAKAARATRNRGVMFSKLIPAAANADQQGSAVSPGSFDQPGGE